MLHRLLLVRCVLPAAVLCVAVTVTAAPTKRQPAKPKTNAAAEKTADDAPDANDESAPRLGPPQTVQFRVGAEISAVNGACRGIIAQVTVPLDCPEQKVTVLSE